MKGSLFDRVRYAREAFDVERCHTHPHLLRYSVGHHSAGVVSLIIQTWLAAHGELPRAELITAALYHDGGELITGDFPSPTKSMLNGALDKVEERVGYYLQNHAGTLEEQEELWLASADSAELYLWCLEEVFIRGNQTFIGWIYYYHDKWQKQPLPPVFEDLVNKAWRNVRRDVPRLTEIELKEIGGL